MSYQTVSATPLAPVLIEARNGPDRIEIFPEVDDEDDLGNPRRVPSEIPVVLHVALHGLAASEFNLLGTAEMSVCLKTLKHWSMLFAPYALAI